MMTKEPNSRTNCHQKDIIYHSPGASLPIPSTKHLLLLLPSSWVYSSPRTHSKCWSFSEQCLCSKVLKGPGLKDTTTFRNANSVQPIKRKRACGPSRRAWCLTPASPTGIPSGCSAVSCRPSPRMAECSGKCPGQTCGLQLTEQVRISIFSGPFKGLGGLSSKESTCNAGHCRFDPWVRKVLWRRKCQPTPIFLSGGPHAPRSLVG